MIEIKFRAWGFASKTIIYPDSELTNGEIIDRMPNNSVMQGDICNYKSASHQTGYKRIIEWNQYNTSFGFTEKDCKNLEVIGNIYQNPYLTKDYG